MKPSPSRRRRQSPVASTTPKQLKSIVTNPDQDKEKDVTKEKKISRNKNQTGKIEPKKTTKKKEQNTAKTKLTNEKQRILQRLNNVLVISDTHVGSKLAILHAPVITDEGGEYHPSPLQKQLFQFWQHIFHEWLPEATKGEPFAIIHNGDVIDGSHHGTTTVITNNLHDQCLFAYDLLKPVVAQANGMFFMVRGTEAHSGKSAQEEENLARQLEAIPNEHGRYCRYDLWLRLGQRFLIHAMHHIGSTGSNAYEATAIHKEVTESLTEAARWGYEPPDVIVRCLHPNCQILTEFGWLSKNQIKPGTMALTININNPKLEWLPITNITEQPAEKDPKLVIIHEKNQPNHVIAITTNDHKILVRRTGCSEIQTIQADELLNPNAELQQKEIVTTPGQFHQLHHPIDPTLYRRIMTAGAILTINHKHGQRPHPNAIKLDIGKAKPEQIMKLKTIKPTIKKDVAIIHPDDSPDSHWITSCLVQSNSGVQLSEPIFQQWIQQGSKPQWLNPLLEGLDHQSYNSHSPSFFIPKNNKLIEQLQTLAVTSHSTIHFKMSPSSREQQRLKVIWNRRQRGLIIGQSIKARIISNQNKTWCVETPPNNSIIVRYHSHTTIPSTPIIIGNSHRHRHAETSIPTAKGRAIGTVTPGWQDKTPFVWKLPGGRLAPAQFGAILIRTSHGRIFVDPKVWTAPRSIIANENMEDQ